MGKGYLLGLLRSILPFLKNDSTLEQNCHILKVVSVKNQSGIQKLEFKTHIQHP